MAGAKKAGRVATKKHVSGLSRPGGIAAEAGSWCRKRKKFCACERKKLILCCTFWNQHIVKASELGQHVRELEDHLEELKAHIAELTKYTKELRLHMKTDGASKRASTKKASLS